LIVNSDISAYGLTADRALYADADKKVTSSAVTPTELGYLSGVTSSIQTQLTALAANGGSSAILAVGNFSGSVTSSAKPMFAPISLTTGRYMATIIVFYNSMTNASSIGQFQGYLSVSLTGGGGTAGVSSVVGTGMVMHQVIVFSTGSIHPVYENTFSTARGSGSGPTLFGVQTIPADGYTKFISARVEFAFDVTSAGTWTPTTYSISGIMVGGSVESTIVVQKMS
jgi:hypothetical protein